MSDAPIPPEEAADGRAEAAWAPARPRRRHRWRWLSHAANLLLSLLLLAVVAALGVRFGALTPAGRRAVLAIANSVHAGPAGRIQAEGLEGDPFGRFRLRRLRIVDARGAWLDARDVRADWRLLELLGRRFHARSLSVGDLFVPRAPVLEPRPPRPPEDLPVAVRLDAVTARVRTGAALTVAAGDWDARGFLDLLRDKRAASRLEAASRIHPGDRLRFDFDLKELEHLRLAADATEAAGGALAGGLGLPADRLFALHAVLNTDSRGGRVDVQSRSGATTPLRAVGRWSRAGADVDAVAALAASRHTAGYVPRIGPEARLRLHATPRGKLYDVQAVLEGAFARATARGPFDSGRRRVEGMAVEARVDDLSTWFKPPKIGPTHAVGIARGGWEDLRIETRVVAERLDELDLRIARMEGTAVVSHGRGDEWRVVTDATGSAVGGLGLLPPLLGPRPVTHVDLSRLADGRVLFRALNVAGRYIRLDAEGAITLLGDLSFKGRFSAPDLRGARPGSHGAIDATFAAASKKGSDFWTLTGEGRGAAFATGLGELDRLLGAAPRLIARGSWTPAGFRLDRADLTGAAANASAAGTFSTQKVMDFAVDWRARGPFTVGPLEIAGAMTGDGKVTGPLAQPRADLHARLQTLDLGRLQVTPAALDLAFISDGAGGLDGSVAVNGPSSYGPATARARFSFAPRGVDLRDVAADAGGVRLAGALALRYGEPSTADLTLAAGPGAFLARGRLAGTARIAAAAAGAAPGGARAVLRLDGRDLQLPGGGWSLRTLQLSADGPIDRLPFRVEADAAEPISWRWAGSGLLAKAGSARELSLDGAGRVRGAPVRTLETARLRFGPDELSARLRLALAGGRLSLDGRQAGETLDAQAELAGVGLGAFNEDYVGEVTGRLALNGRGRALGGRFDAALKGARTRDATADLALDAAVRGELASGRLRLNATATNAQGLKADGRLDLPAEAAAKPFRVAVERTRPFTGELAVDGELRPLWDLFLGGERTVSGKLTARASLAGTLADPKVTGGAQLAGGAVTDTGVGLTLKNLEGSAEFGRNLVTVRRFAGDDGKGGTLAGEGSVSLARDGGSTLRLDVRRFHLFDNEYGRATTSGQVTVTRDASGRAKLVGRLGVDRADITAKAPATAGVVAMDVIELNAPARPGAEPAAGPTRRASATAVGLDVTIQAPRGLFVRGRGLDVELSLDAHVGGTTAAPDLSGTARVVRGSYDFSGKRFDFNEFGAIRLAAKPELIRLDLTAERNENGLDARVRVTGTAANPVISLTSIPVLPQDEILSRVLFGVSASQLSPFEAAQLASAVAALATGGGLDVLGSLRQFAGLDRLALGGGPSGATISGGKYLTNDVYLELTGAGNGRGESQTQNLQTGRTGSSATLEWRVRRNLSLLGQVWTGGASRLSVRFRQNR